MSRQMLAGRLCLADRTFALVTVPVPEPGPGEVRVEVAAAGVCLSDIHLIDGTLPLPAGASGTVILGHEVAGTIDAVGPKVRGWRVGQRVVLHAGQARRDGSVATRGVDFDGGWAQYVIARRDTLVAIPDHLPFEQACIIPDAVSTPWAAITGTARVRSGEAVGVWGAGGLGTHAVQLLRLVGAAPIVVVDPHGSARERALSLGADLAVNPADADLRQSVMDATDGAGLNVAFDFAGVSPAREQAFGLLGRCGRLVLTGIANAPVLIPSDSAFTFLQQSVLGHYGSDVDNVEEVVGLIGDGRLDLSGSVSAVLDLADVEQAVERLRTRSHSQVRLVLRP